MGEKDWNKVSKKYTKILVNESVSFPTFKKIIKDLNLKNASVIDIGCGNGQHSLILAKNYNYKILATDISKNMIEDAKNNNAHKKIKFDVMDATKINQKDKTFNLALINTLLCNLPSKNKFFKVISEASRVLKNNGYLIISNPHPSYEHMSFPKYRERRFKKKYDYFKGGFEYNLKLFKEDGSFVKVINYHYPLETYCEALNNAKMKIVKIVEPKFKKGIGKEKDFPPLIFIVAQKI